MSFESTLMSEVAMQRFKTFAVIDRVHPNMPDGGSQTIFRFPNGYGASVVRSQYTYGGDRGLYELAVISDFEGQDETDIKFSLTYETDVTNDVEGYLTVDKVIDLLNQIQELPNE